MQTNLGSPSGHYLRAIRRHWMLVLVVPLVALVAAVGWTKSRHRQYQFTARILVTPIPGGDPTLDGLSVLHDSADPATTIQTAAALVDSEAATKLTAQRLGPAWSTTRVHSTVSVQPEGGSNLIDVTATAGDPGAAARVANTFAQASLDARNAALQQQINAALAALQAQQAAVGNAGGTGPGSLSDKITTLEGERGLPDPTFSLAQPAAPATIAGASTKKVAALALLAGLVLGCAAAILMDLLDGTVRDEDDLAAAYPVPVLARLPRVRVRRKRPWRRGRSAMPTAMYEALRELLLQVEHVSGDSRTVMVTSATTRDGKTSLAIGLALTAAVSGREVALIECDFRHPTLASRLGLSGTSDLGSILQPEVEVRDLMQRLPALPSLNVLATSNRVAGASQLQQLGMIERVTRRLPELIREAGERSDLVILDAPALSEVSDGLRILPSADCVLLVARLRHTTRSALTRCGDLLARAGRTPLGLVLTGPAGRRHPRYETAFADGRGISDLARAAASDQDPAQTTVAPR
jgi:Mrp family chromosome partitioning ATPase/capsular polysaccharide biosynthesis protein